MSMVGMTSRDGVRIPLKGVEVDAEVVGAHTRVLLRQRYRNDEARAVEAVYTFPLPSDATLTAFAMTAEGRRVEGVVQEREKAFQTYDDAVVSGHGAALLEQERPNVFTATVGNLLPGEETLVELEYLQRVTADEGALRWILPTLVAPRYIPGAPAGDRTGHGSAAPTDRVPDADRISPPAGGADYGITLSLVFDLGRDLTVESSSHAITVTREGRKVRVSFAHHEVALDRDVVVTARGVAEGPLAAVAVHRTAGSDGALALTVVPDLYLAARSGAARQDVVFLIDTSGSMEGASITEARAALRLCLRHLREGDRFNVVAFNTQHTAFARDLVPYGQRTLEDADRWVAGLHAHGGTELLDALLASVTMAPDGVLVLLTDGQVGNEDEILRRVLAARGRARVYSFGIGTNVSDTLLRDMARHTGAAVEFIHPGERIDEKVVAVFARAVAARVTGVAVRFDGVDVGELCPSVLPDLVDGEPWTLMGRYAAGGGGRALVTGTLGGAPWTLDVPLDLPETVSRPVVARLWASERVRDLEGTAARSGRSAEAMRARIVALGVAYGIATRYTSFVVVEKRTGDRRVQGQPEVRAIPVHLPAGWAMFDHDAERTASAGGTAGGGRAKKLAGAPGMGAAMQPQAASRGAPPPPALGGAMPRRPAPAGPPSPMAPPPPAPMAAPMPVPSQALSSGGILGRARAAVESVFGAATAGPMPPPPPAPPAASAPPMAMASVFADMAREESVAGSSKGVAGDPVVAVLERQLASGLWDDGGPGSTAGRQVRATRDALRTLLAAGVDSTHGLHGAQVRKAVEALIPLAVTLATQGGSTGATPGASTEAALAANALGYAWLVTTGRRTRTQIQAATGGVPGLTALTARLGDEAALRAWLEASAG